MEDRLRNRTVGITQIDRISFPVARPVGTLEPNSRIRVFAFPGNVETPIESCDRGRLVALGTSASIRREIVLLELIRGRLVRGTNAKENPVAGGAIREPELSMPTSDLKKYKTTRTSRREK